MLIQSTPTISNTHCLELLFFEFFFGIFFHLTFIMILFYISNAVILNFHDVKPFLWSIQLCCPVISKWCRPKIKQCIFCFGATFRLEKTKKNWTKLSSVIRLCKFQIVFIQKKSGYPYRRYLCKSKGITVCKRTGSQ